MCKAFFSKYCTLIHSLLVAVHSCAVILKLRRILLWTIAASMTYFSTLKIAFLLLWTALPWHSTLQDESMHNCRSHGSSLDNSVFIDLIDRHVLILKLLRTRTLFIIATVACCSIMRLIHSLLFAVNSYALILKLLRTIKATEDASLEPLTEHVHLMCDLGLILAKQLVKLVIKDEAVTMPKVGGGVPLPRHLFRPFSKHRPGEILSHNIIKFSAQKVIHIQWETNQMDSGHFQDVDQVRETLTLQ